jgi:pyruvate dehydrogenase E2 component (dihydrolipoamide acetyltransferase)
MPKQGQSVETCVLLEWMKKKGERIKKGDILFSYETDKASFEFESPVAGVLLETFFNAQDDVPVHTTVAVVGEPGESIEQFRPEGDSPADVNRQAVKTITPTVVSDVIETTAPAASTATAGPSAASPRARRKAMERGIDLSMVNGTGPRGRIIERDVLAQPALTKTAMARRNAEGLSVPARNLSPGDRIRVADLVETKTQITGSPADDVVSEVKLSNMRKIIGTRMQQSLQQSAQLTMNAFADATALLACRKRFKAQGKEPGRTADVTITDMIALAVARTLPSHPELNSLYKDEKVLGYAHVHLAMAVDTPRGLMVPVVRFADQLSLESLSVRLKELAAQCREGSINPDLLTGGTITISNLGTFGIESFTPILNPPQVAILGVNAIVPRIVQAENGDYTVRPHIGFSLTIDHRVVDGAPGARFLKELCDHIAAADSMLAVWG